jgi:peptidoglycan/LPS O-acetylase OafA/YrhL
MSTQSAAPDSTNVRRIYYLIGLAGAILLLLGVFMSAVQPTLGRDRLYLEYFLPEGIILILLVATAFILMKRRELRRLVFIGALAFGVLAFSYLRNEHQKSARISAAYGRIYTGDSEDKETDPQLRKLNKEAREGMAEVIRSFEEGERYGAGWWVMLVGSVMLLGTGLLTYSSVEQWVLTSFALFEQPKKK